MKCRFGQPDWSDEAREPFLGNAPPDFRWCSVRKFRTEMRSIGTIRPEMWVLFLVLGSMLGTRLFGQALPPGSQPQMIHGRVINSVTLEPIGRALVSSADNRFATLTDSDGHFEFPVSKAEASGGDGFAGGVRFRLTRNRFWLKAKKPGFLDIPNPTRQVEPSSDNEITISLMPEALISGRVMLSATDPAFGISVQIFSRQTREGIFHWVPGASAQANSNGEFRFAELLPGAYRLVTHELLDTDPVDSVPGLRLYGFPPVYYPGVTDFSAAGIIQLAAGQSFQAEFSAVRQPYYAVEIPVAAGDPSAAINITVSVEGHRGPGYSLGYNAEKKRIEGLLPNGNYVVEAETFGPNAANAALNLALAGARVEGPTMVLTRNTSIRVNVAEEFSSTNQQSSASWREGNRNFSVHGPRLYLQLSAESADDFQQPKAGSIRPPTGPNDDALVLEGLPPGRYWLRLNSSRGYVAQATMGGVDLLHEPFSVTAGSGAPIEITMRDDGAEIEGTVAGGPATDAPDGDRAYVYCVPLQDGSAQFKELEVSEGRFNSPSMAPGTYHVLVFKNQQPALPYRDPEAMRAFEAKGQVVHLAAGQRANLQLQVIASSE